VGHDLLKDALRFEIEHVERLDTDVYARYVASSPV
jgi:hypothetical protein